MPNILGNHSFPVHTYRWRQIAVCKEEWPLKNLIPHDKCDDYRIISNEPAKEREEK
jgi:predicted  nucleic acid-binding Zn ribbon protein